MLVLVKVYLPFFFAGKIPGSGVNVVFELLMFVIIRIYFRQIASYLVWLSLHKLFFLFNFNLFDPLLSETGKQVFFRPIKIWALVQHGSGRSSKQDCKRFLELHKWASMAHKVLHFFCHFFSLISMPSIWLLFTQNSARQGHGFPCWVIP